MFHRFLKYSKYFRRATEVLPEYQKALQDEIEAIEEEEPESPQVEKPDIICLLTSSSDEVSEDDEDENNLPEDDETLPEEDEDETHPEEDETLQDEDETLQKEDQCDQSTAESSEEPDTNLMDVEV